MHEIIDVACNIGPYAPALAEAGVRSVIRYYNHRNSEKLPTKCLSLAERDQIFAAGLSLAIVFQQNGRNPADFASGKGTADARRALELATKLAQPQGSAIYFGVDTDFYRASELQLIRNYFTEVNAEIAGKYRVGVYGSGTVGTMLQNAGLVSLAWLAAARKWSGTQAALQSGTWVLDQRFLEKISLIGGFKYDGNIFNPAHANFGQYDSSGAIDSKPGEGTAALFRVTATPNVNIRPTPGKVNDPIGSLPKDAVVRGLARSGGWIKVDVNGDGYAEGFVRSDYLLAISGDLPMDMPLATAPIEVARVELAQGIREFPGAAHNPRILMYHRTTGGDTESDEQPWCSSFVNYCVEQAGLIGTKSKWARSWHESGWGSAVTEDPREGDVVVWRRKGPGEDGGHVGFFLDATDAEIRVLGGNQGNAVSIGSFPRDGEKGGYRYTLLSIRRG